MIFLPAFVVCPSFFQFFDLLYLFLGSPTGHKPEHILTGVYFFAFLAKFKHSLIML